MLEFLGIKLKKAVRPTILVVDDEPKVVQTLQDRLEMNDYTVHTAYDGIEALGKAVRFKPDIVLLDIIMPEMDGLEMLEALRANPECEDISVIMLTARSHADDMERAYACGIEDFIVKPFELRSLLEKIETIIQNKKAPVA
jgi:two-component system alkaline phosphatase synthesis response regulator PhoP